MDMWQWICLGAFAIFVLFMWIAGATQNGPSAGRSGGGGEAGAEFGGDSGDGCGGCGGE